MKKWTLILALLVIGMGSTSVAQTTYVWPGQNISLVSWFELETAEYPSGFHLEGGGITIDFARLAGMEGVNGLAPSLDRYAASFGYEVQGNSREFAEVENMAAARLDGKREGQNLVLLLLATPDYQKHFSCEIIFPASRQRAVDVLISTIACTAPFEENETEVCDEEPQNNQPDDSREQDRADQRDEEPAVNTHLSGTPVQKRVWQLLSTYSPEGYYILDEYYKAPAEYGGHSISGDDDFSTWIDGASEQEIVKSLNTVVHEMDHAYTGKLYLKALQETGRAADGDYSAFYLGDGETRLVRHTGVFLTREIDSMYPKKLVTERYATYVHPSTPDMGSQQDGIYGLLDEWNAYYHGTRTSADLYDYYRERRDDAEGWREFFADYYSTYYAYLEFKSYILVYMMYAKRNYPQYFRGFMNNADLLHALKRTDERWSTLINHFKVLKKNCMADLSAKGARVEEKDGYLYINGTGYGNFSDVYTNFQEELKKPVYQEIAGALGFASAGGPDF
jgi:hypothetical protein